MNNLAKQLNNLKDIKPDHEWKKSNRDLLLAQISATQESASSTEKQSWINDLPTKIMRGISQPAIAVFFISLFLVSSGVFSVVASRDAKPGNSLYTAKIVSEKTQLALTFGEKKKARLRVEFAGNRAREIDQVLSETEEREEGKSERVVKLVDNFKKEITAARVGLEKVSHNNDQDSEPPATDTEDVVSEEEHEPVAVFSANSMKQEDGISISDSINKSEDEKQVALEGSEDEVSIASGSEEVGIEDVGHEGDSTSTMITAIENPQDILMQAGELIENNELDSALSLLEEANTAIDQTVDDGKVKGVEASASSTDTGEVLGVEKVASGTESF